MYDAIQKGFERTSGEIMGWIGSDDMYHPKSFFTAAEIFSSFKNIKWLVGAATIFDEYGRTISVCQSRKFSRYDFLSDDYKWLQQESCFWHRTLWDCAGSKLDTSLRYAGDFELWIRFFRFEQLYVINALIGGFRQRSSNQLSLEGMNSYVDEAETILQQEKLTKDELWQFHQYRKFKQLIKILDKMKIFNVERILKKYQNIKFDMSEIITFDRLSQKYILN
jgi:hypothetical protein